MADIDFNITGTIGDGAVTNSKLSNMDSQRIKGRATAGSGSPEDLTANQVSTILDGATDPFLRTSALPLTPYSLLPTWTVGTQATTSTSLTDVTDTELTVPSAGLYEVEYRVTYDANATTTGAGFSIRNTVGGTLDYNAVTAFLDAVTSDKGVVVGGTTTSLAVASSRATTANTAIVHANLIFNAASAIRLQFRTEIATSTTITVTNVIGFIRRAA
jgi:hypothetical protein